MIWINRLFLFAMFLVYLPIGIWAILDPVFGALEMDLPSFLEAVGLNIVMAQAGLFASADSMNIRPYKQLFICNI